MCFRRQVEEEIEDPDFCDNLLNQKKSEENEGRIKRQCRRLSREGNITDEDRDEFRKLYLAHVGSPKTPGFLSSKSEMSSEEAGYFKLFCTPVYSIEE